MSTHYYDDVSPRPVRRKHTARNVLLILLAFAVIAAGTVAAYTFSLANSFNSKTTTIESAFPEGATRPTRAAGAEGAMNILLMGSDAGTTDANADAASTDPGGSRSDTMMLMHIPQNRENIFVMSIMRDTWADIPGYGEHKINAAMSLGGVPLVIQTVESMFKAPIDHVVIVDFEGFEGLTDALGGVTVDNPSAFQSRGSQGEFFDQGNITLDGDSALKFVRERYAFSDGDYQRVRNQQLYIKAVMSAFLSRETLTDPARISRVVNEISPYLSVDEELNAATVGSLALDLQHIRTGDIEFFTLPNLGPGTSADGQSIIIRDDVAIAEIARVLDEGSLGDYLKSTDFAEAAP